MRNTQSSWSTLFKNINSGHVVFYGIIIKIFIAPSPVCWIAKSQQKTQSNHIFRICEQSQKSKIILQLVRRYCWFSKIRLCINASIYKCITDSVSYFPDRSENQHIFWANDSFGNILLYLSTYAPDFCIKRFPLNYSNRSILIFLKSV